MPVAAPAVVRQALGEEVVVEFVPWVEQIVREQALPWIEQIVQEKTVSHDEYRRMLLRQDVLERNVAEIQEDLRFLRDEIGDLRREMNERFDRVHERFDQMNAQFNERFDQMNAQFNERLDRVNEHLMSMERHMEMRFDQMSERMLVQTRWLIGSIALFGTIITVLLAISQFTP